MSDPVYTPNSHKYKEQQNASPTEEKKVTKVVNGPVKTKRNDIRKLADIFISEDVSNVKSYIFMDVLVPAIEKAIELNTTVVIDCVIDQDDKVFPMVPAGASIADAFDAEDLKNKEK